MQHVARVAKAVKRARPDRPDPNLQDAAQFFEELGRSSPGAFAGFFFREVAVLLGRIAKGNRVTPRAWRCALGNVRAIVRISRTKGIEGSLPAGSHLWATAFSEKRMRVDDFNRRTAPAAAERVQDGAA